MRGTVCASLIAALAAAGPNFGKKECPSFSPMADFDLSRYTGTWYEIVRDRATPFELLASCVVADYTPRDDGGISVTNAGYRYSSGW